MKPLVTTVDSPLECLNDQLHAELEMPEGCISQLLACDEQYRVNLQALFMVYREVFPIELPKKVPPNQGLGDEISIKLVPGKQPI